SHRSIPRRPAGDSQRLHRGRQGDRARPLAAAALRGAAGAVPHRAAVAFQRAHLAVQGHRPRRRDRRAGTDVRRALDQREHVPGAGDLDHGDGPLSRRLLHDRDRPAPGRAPLHDGALMHWSQLFHQIYVARWTLWGGLVTTLEISVLVIIAGTIVGLMIGLGLCFGHLTVRLALRGDVDLIRGVPSLVLIFFSFYGTPLLGLDISAFLAGVFALAAFAAAHIGELTRGAIQSIPHAQMDAAKSIGLGFWGRLAYAIMPQALRRMLAEWVDDGAQM